MRLTKFKVRRKNRVHKIILKFATNIYQARKHNLDSGHASFILAYGSGSPWLKPVCTYTMIKVCTRWWTKTQAALVIYSTNQGSNIFQIENGKWWRIWILPFFLWGMCARSFATNSWAWPCIQQFQFAQETGAALEVTRYLLSIYLSLYTKSPLIFLKTLLSRYMASYKRC